MKYLSVANYCFIDHPGGAPRVAWDMCMIMRNRGHDVTMFCPKDKPDNPEMSMEHGIRVVRFEMPETFALDPFKIAKRTGRGKTIANKYLRDTSWDVVHSHVPIEGKLIHDVLGSGPRYVCTVHSPAVLEQHFIWSTQGWKGMIKRLLGTHKLKHIEGFQLGAADRIHTLSQFTKHEIHKFHGVANKTRVIPHWCRNDFVRDKSKVEAREILGWPRDATTLFTLRGMRERYGIDIALRAAAPVLKRHNDVYFMLGGDGPLRTALMQLACTLGIDKKTTFLGRLSDEMVRRCYEAADVFILPTRSMECFGLIVLEAYAYGLPIISTDAGALPELIRPIAPHMVIPAGQVEPLQETLEEFVEGTLRIPSADHLIEYVQKDYSYEAIVPKIVELLENNS
jgi:glycosyltransferase involved in cell wall biosynthesis